MPEISYFYGFVFISILKNIIHHIFMQTMANTLCLFTLMVGLLKENFPSVHWKFY